MARAIAFEAVAMKLARLPWPYTEENARAWLTTPTRANDVNFVILSHEDPYPQIIGGIALTRNGDAHELGYWLTPAAWNRGYATEAGRAVVTMARSSLPVRRLVSAYHLDNPASGNVLRKLGFRATGRTEMRHSVARGGTVETALVDYDMQQDRNAWCR
ncbi:GNAT family N-acetyltransferase [uncultured Sphingomonas sp.]|uniref:GNAT family N-acetyltransferase n=1 Tax=Sphingomonas bacterium TaxID=1895847 RepID=UPI0020C5CD28